MTEKTFAEILLDQPDDFLDEAFKSGFAALKRIDKVACRAGADAKDILEIRALPALRALEKMRSKELESVADIGRRVKGGWTKIDRSNENMRRVEVFSCAITMLQEGVPKRGLAAKIKKKTKVDLTVRQINRILER